MSPLQAFFDWQRMAIWQRLVEPMAVIRQREGQPYAPQPSEAKLKSRYTPSLPSNRPTTYRKNTAPIKHGTLNGYTRWKCRCEACCAVHAAYQRAYHMRQQQQRIQQQGGAA